MHYKTHMKKIIKIQALYRAIKARKITEVLKTQVKSPSKYFTEEEIRETLNGVFRTQQK